MPVPRGYNWSMDFTFDGTVDAADASQLIIAIFLTRPGDINLDYQVDDDDFAILANNFGTGNEWTEGDLNGDGTVDLEDFVILDDNYPWP
jgi:hypothetical protein